MKVNERTRNDVMKSRMELPMGECPAARVVRRSSNRKGCPIPIPFGATDTVNRNQNSYNQNNGKSNIHTINAHNDEDSKNDEIETEEAERRRLMPPEPVVGIVMERRKKKKTPNSVPFQAGNSTGFPSLQVPLGTLVDTSTSFASRKTHKLAATTTAATTKLKTESTSSSSTPLSSSLMQSCSHDAQSILSGMSELDIQQTVQELTTALSPKTINFLKTRKLQQRKNLNQTKDQICQFHHHQQQEPQHYSNKDLSTTRMNGGSKTSHKLTLPKFSTDEIVTSTSAAKNLTSEDDSLNFKVIDEKIFKTNVCDDIIGAFRSFDQDERREKERIAKILTSIRSYEDLDRAYESEMVRQQQRLITLDDGTSNNDNNNVECNNYGANDHKSDWENACELLRSSSPHQKLWASRFVCKKLQSDIKHLQQRQIQKPYDQCSINNNLNDYLQHDIPVLLPVSLRCLLDEGQRSGGSCSGALRLLHTYVLQSIHSLILLLTPTEWHNSFDDVFVSVNKEKNDDENDVVQAFDDRATITGGTHQKISLETPPSCATTKHTPSTAIVSNCTAIYQLYYMDDFVPQISVRGMYYGTKTTMNPLGSSTLGKGHDISKNNVASSVEDGSAGIYSTSSSTTTSSATNDGSDFLRDPMWTLVSKMKIVPRLAQLLQMYVRYHHLYLDHEHLSNSRGRHSFSVHSGEINQINDKSNYSNNYDIDNTSCISSKTKSNSIDSIDENQDDVNDYLITQKQYHQPFLENEPLVWSICGILTMVGQRSPGIASAIAQHPTIVYDLATLTGCTSDSCSSYEPKLMVPFLNFLCTLSRQSRVVAESIIVIKREDHFHQQQPSDSSKAIDIGTIILRAVADRTAPKENKRSNTSDTRTHYHRMHQCALMLWRTLLRYGLSLSLIPTMLTLAAPHLTMVCTTSGKSSDSFSILSQTNDVCVLNGQHEKLESIHSNASLSLSKEFYSCFTMVLHCIHAIQLTSTDTQPSINKILATTTSSTHRLTDEQLSLLRMALVWLSSSSSKRQALSHLSQIETMLVKPKTIIDDNDKFSCTIQTNTLHEALALATSVFRFLDLIIRVSVTTTPKTRVEHEVIDLRDYNLTPSEKENLIDVLCSFLKSNHIQNLFHLVCSGSTSVIQNIHLHHLCPSQVSGRNCETSNGLSLFSPISLTSTTTSPEETISDITYHAFVESFVWLVITLSRHSNCLSPTATNKEKTNHRDRNRVIVLIQSLQKILRNSLLSSTAPSHMPLTHSHPNQKLKHQNFGSYIKFDEKHETGKLADVTSHSKMTDGTSSSSFVTMKQVHCRNMAHFAIFSFFLNKQEATAACNDDLVTYDFEESLTMARGIGYPLLGRLQVGDERTAAIMFSNEYFLMETTSLDENENIGDFSSILSGVLVRELCRTSIMQKQLDHSYRLHYGSGINSTTGLGPFHLESLRNECESVSPTSTMRHDEEEQQILPLGPYWPWRLLLGSWTTSTSSELATNPVISSLDNGATTGHNQPYEEYVSVLLSTLRMLANLEVHVPCYTQQLNVGGKLYYLSNLCFLPEPILLSNESILVSNLAEMLFDTYVRESMSTKYNLSVDSLTAVAVSVSFTKECRKCSLKNSCTSKSKSNDDNSYDDNGFNPNLSKNDIKQMKSILLETERWSEAPYYDHDDVKALLTYVQDVCDAFLENGAIAGQFKCQSKVHHDKKQIQSRLSSLFVKFVQIFLWYGFPTKIRCEVLLRLRDVLHLLSLNSDSDTSSNNDDGMALVLLRRCLPGGMPDVDDSLRDKPEFLDAVVTAAATCTSMRIFSSSTKFTTNNIIEERQHQPKIMSKVEHDSYETWNDKNREILFFPLFAISTLARSVAIQVTAAMNTKNFDMNNIVSSLSVSKRRLMKLDRWYASAIFESVHLFLQTNRTIDDLLQAVVKVTTATIPPTQQVYDWFPNGVKQDEDWNQAVTDLFKSLLNTLSKEQ